MYLQEKQLKSLQSIELTAEEGTILKWLRSAPWQAQTGAREPTYKAKVPEFYSGVRLYRVQATGPTGAGAMGALDLFIKKISFQGVISKQELYPVTAEGPARFLSLRRADLDNLGVRLGGGDDEDE